MMWERAVLGSIIAPKAAAGRTVGAARYTITRPSLPGSAANFLFRALVEWQASKTGRTLVE
eukprot:15431814-Alexandrium_andersonii.AAC.1